MKKSMKMFILAVMTAILAVLLIVPTNLSSDVLRTGKPVKVNGIETCNCVDGGSVCGCLTKDFPTD